MKRTIFGANEITMSKSIALLAVLTLSTFAFAQRTQQEAAATAEVTAATTTCSYTFTSGSGRPYTTYCVTANGNITSFQSPSGVEFINVGIVSEGYGICDLNSGANYYDYAWRDSGNWLTTSVVSSTPTSVKLNRITSDGIWQLTQTITETPASATSTGSAKVTMALKNLTGVTRSAYLLRYADVDANGVTSPNDFDNTLDSASGLQPGFSYGLTLTNNTFTFGREAFVQKTFDGPTPCSFGANFATTPFVGDGSLGVVYGLSVPSGATKTVVMTYKPI